MFQDTVSVQITSADIPEFLRDMISKEITAIDLELVDDLTVRLSVSEKDYKDLFTLVKKRGDHLKRLKAKGLITLCQKAIKRPAFVVGIILLLLLSIYLPTRILFVQVDGNQNISTQLLLQQAEECGIRFGASRRNVRSERVKNNLLSRVPDLQWAGVNTYGCVAIISVEEKSEPNRGAEERSVSSIVSAADGVITECTVRKGTALCAVGDAVREGQLLVSGYTDCGLKVQAQSADAEIVAETIHKMEVITPGQHLTRGIQTAQRKKFSLLIGKKLINFYNGSGISDSTCVKMYSRKYITLPGGLQLPVALVTVEHCEYTMVGRYLQQDQARELLEDSAKGYLIAQLSAGKIEKAETVQLHDKDCYRHIGEYICTEMIGRTIYEERLYTHGEDD